MKIHFPIVKMSVKNKGKCTKVYLHSVDYRSYS